MRWISVILVAGVLSLGQVTANAADPNAGAVAPTKVQTPTTTAASAKSEPMAAVLGALLGALIGSLSSLLGVWLTLRHSQKTHEANIQEERRKAREAREFLAKQSALLAAVEAMNRFIAYYTSLADRTLPDDGTVAAETTELDVALNRLHFYCTMETIEKATSTGFMLTQVAIEAMKAKIPSGLIAANIMGVDTQIAGIEKMNAAIQDEINAMLQSDARNPLLASHKEQQALNFTMLAKCYEKRNELIRQKYTETERCRDVIARNLMPIYGALMDVLLLARRELSFPIDEARYKIAIGHQLDSMAKSFEEFLAETRKQIYEKWQQDEEKSDQSTT